MSEILPDKLRKREPINLRLGIKSSLGDIRPLIAALYVIFKATGKQATVAYSTEVNDNGSISIQLNGELASKIANTFSQVDNVVQLVNESPLFKSQVEALQVGCELFFRLAKVRFVENSHQERTGMNRYGKQLMFTLRMLQMDMVLARFTDDQINTFLSKWLQDKDTNDNVERSIKLLLTTFVESCFFKVRSDNGFEFNTEGVYSQLLKGATVTLKDSDEIVGPTRVLNSFLNDGLHYFVSKKKNSGITILPENKERLQSYSELVSNTLDLIPKNLLTENLSVSAPRPSVSSPLPRSLPSLLLPSLRTKPFVLLAGISGTGKSRAVRALAYSSCPLELRDSEGTAPGNFLLVEVKPNWHDSSELLGYQSNLAGRYLFTPFVGFLVRAMMHPRVPFFVCLDEMNLAPVEQYLAEFLSVLETRRRDDLEPDRVRTAALVGPEHFRGEGEGSGSLTDGQWDQRLHNEACTKAAPSDATAERQLAFVGRRLTSIGLTLPDNVFVVGTINMDDTTHGLSRKVLDRAMTLEMNGGDLTTVFGGEGDLEYSAEPYEVGHFRGSYLTAAEVSQRCGALSSEARERLLGNSEESLARRLQYVNTILAGTPYAVSYRVMNELSILLGVLLDEQCPQSAAEMGVAEQCETQALDAILLMKVLPRVEGDVELLSMSNAERQQPDTPGTIEGSEHAREPTKLDWLLSACQRWHLELSAAKLREMIGRLERLHYTRFWP